MWGCLERRAWLLGEPASKKHPPPPSPCQGLPSGLDASACHAKTRRPSSVSPGCCLAHRAGCSSLTLPSSLGAGANQSEKAAAKKIAASALKAPPPPQGRLAIALLAPIRRRASRAERGPPRSCSRGTQFTSPASPPTQGHLGSCRVPPGRHMLGALLLLSPTQGFPPAVGGPLSSFPSWLLHPAKGFHLAASPQGDGLQGPKLKGVATSLILSLASERVQQLC